MNDLSKAESTAQFNNDADQIIKATVAAAQHSAAPLEVSEEGIRPSQLPRNYSESVNALNDAKVSFSRPILSFAGFFGNNTFFDPYRNVDKSWQMSSRS